MKRNAISVPYGYEVPKEKERGTLIFYDSFEQITDEELDTAVEQAIRRSFQTFVLYPLHEETVRRMTKNPVSPYYKREDRLHDWKRSREPFRLKVIIEGWEGRRKKYTPIDTALRQLTESYPAPYFLYLTPETANMFASYSSFEDWIVKLRLLLTEDPSHSHPRLQQYANRWNSIQNPVETH